MLDLVVLSDAAGTRVGAMSKGMQRRLRIAQALVGSPRLLLLDEPPARSTRPASGSVASCWTSCGAQRFSAPLVASLSEVELVCDRVAILVGGEIVERGTPATLVRPRGSRSRPRPEAADRSAGREDAPGSWPSWSPRASGCTAWACSPRRSRTPTWRRSERRPGDRHAPVRRPDDRRLRAWRKPRKRVFVVVVALTVAFLALLASARTSRSARSKARPGRAMLMDEQALTGGTIFGLAMFAGPVPRQRPGDLPDQRPSVRGDAESGLLQPLVVRPLGRGTMLLARYLGAVAATTVYVLGSICSPC